MQSNPELVAACGLYCGACRKYQKNQCPGCAKNEKATWCKVRMCNERNGEQTCAHCTRSDPAVCKDAHNFISNFMGFIFRTDKNAALVHIKTHGLASYAEEMANKNSMAPKK